MSTRGTLLTFQVSFPSIRWGAFVTSIILLLSFFGVGKRPTADLLRSDENW
jgi:hypothetical protein